MAASEVEEPAPPLKYKTSVLRVSVHCEGCKRKVNKILHQVEGVYRTEIDVRQQKVTVVGNADAETLIRKLKNSGKNAQLWPENTDQKENKSSKPNNKEKQNDSQSKTNQEGGQQGTGADVKEIKAPLKPEVVVQESAKHGEGGSAAADRAAKNGGDGGDASGVKAGKESGSNTKNGCAVQVMKEAKSEEKEAEADASGDQPPPSAVEKKVGDSDGGAEKPGAGGGGSSKKKKKKGENRNKAEGGEPSTPVPADIGSPNQNAGPPPVSVPTTNIPLHQHGFQQYPPHYYAPAPPLYTMSYNTAYPTHTYTTSYYAPVSPPPSYYAYSYPHEEMEPPPFDLGSYPPQPSDSFEIFSDENPNGCLIM